VLCCIIGPASLGYGGRVEDDLRTQKRPSPLPEFAKATLVRLNTAALASRVQAGKEIKLPYGRPGGGVINRKVKLTLRNLRGPTLTELVLKDGDAGTGSTMPLPPPATYQGKVHGGGAAVFTITPDVVEGSMLVAPGGWAFIEPLEPLLRLRNVDPAERERLLKQFNHVVYNTVDFIGDQLPNDNPGGSPEPVSSPQPPAALVMSVVADGDPGLFRSYPLDSTMPFWLKQETILNAIDWLYNCVEPEATADNAYSNCGNAFDGGSNEFQARVRIDRLEVWTSGGPTGTLRNVRDQSIVMSHQSSPVCCGEPHTAGHADVVHFFSGAGFADGAGEAKGIGGVSYYGPLCLDETFLSKCHHAVSQIVPNIVSPEFTFYGNAFEQQVLVAHEIGHVNNASEFGTRDSTVCWLFGKACGQSVMASGSGFTHRNLFLYDPNDTERNMGPLLNEKLERAPGTP
jgi:hypothetical protein